MKWVGCVLLLAVGCKKEAAPSSATPGAARGAAMAAPPVRDAAVADAAPAAASPVELLRTVPATIRVSSQVRNSKIKPKHLADRDLQTAWNSLTGDLVGAWIEVTLEAGTHVAELRMTVGHTGHGPKGEDYFTMNPRIAKLEIARDGLPKAVVALDPGKRELQVVPIDATSHVRITIVEITMGTKKRWREVAVSELEVWGAPPPGWVTPTASLTPLVLVGDPVSSTDPDDPCANLEAKKAEREARRNDDDEKCRQQYTGVERVQCMVDPPGDPDCTEDPVTVDKLGPPWKNVSTSCDVYDNIYGPKTCALSVGTADGGAVAAEVQLDSLTEVLEIDEAVMADVIPGRPAELVFRYHRGRDRDTSALVVCRATPYVACSAPIALAGVNHAVAWSADVTFESGAAVLSTTSGHPGDDEIGRKPLVFR